jgi:hypothetical protein
MQGVTGKRLEVLGSVPVSRGLFRGFFLLINQVLTHLPVRFRVWTRLRTSLAAP